MNIQELSVGDWVRVISDNVSVKVIGLREVYCGCIEVVAVSDTTQYMLMEEHRERYRKFDPITLTPEILEKNGWSKEYDDVWECGVWRIKQINKCLFVLYNENYDYDFCVYIDTVHKLQHALRLAGVGKKIEL